MTTHLTIPNIARSTTILLATLGTIVGLRTFTYPLAAAEDFGLPQSPTSSSSSANAFIRVCGGRNLASGLALLALAYRRNWDAVGVVMVCGSVTAGVDAVVVYGEGTKTAAYGHAVMGALSLGLGGWFLGLGS